MTTEFKKKSSNSFHSEAKHYLIMSRALYFPYILIFTMSKYSLWMENKRAIAFKRIRVGGKTFLISGPVYSLMTIELKKSSNSFHSKAKYHLIISRALYFPCILIFTMAKYFEIYKTKFQFLV